MNRVAPLEGRLLSEIYRNQLAKIYRHHSGAQDAQEDAQRCETHLLSDAFLSGNQVYNLQACEGEGLNLCNSVYLYFIFHLQAHVHRTRDVGERVYVSAQA